MKLAVLWEADIQNIIQRTSKDPRWVSAVREKSRDLIEVGASGKSA